MKILLVAINAKYIHSNLAVYSLKKYAEEHGTDCKNLIQLGEYTINHSSDEILSQIFM